MLGYLEIDAFGEGLKIELVKENKLGEFSIQYHKTAQQIFDISGRIDGIVIPYRLGDQYDYNLLLMILHIRLFSHGKLNQMPIVVYTENVEGYVHFCDNQTISEQVYNSIGVSIPEPPLGVSIPEPSLPENVELLHVDRIALKQFLKEKAGYPWFTQGRHDQANRWGRIFFCRFSMKFLEVILFPYGLSRIGCLKSRI